MPNISVITLSAVCVLLVGITGAVGYKAYSYRSAAITAQKEAISAVSKDRLAAVIRSMAGISATDDPKTITARLMDYVYRTDRVGNPAADVDNDFARFFRLGTTGGDEVCGGMSMALSWALNIVGVRARVVQLAAQSYLDGKAEGDTHVTVEVFLDGAWHIYDPTFNVTIGCSTGGDRMSIDQARACVAKGGKLTFTDGETQIAGRTPADYYLPYADFLAAYKSEAGEDPPGWLEKALPLYS